MTLTLSLRKRVFFGAVMVLAAYLVLESLATALAWMGWWGTTLWLFEDSGRTWHFDPIRGCKLEQAPSRFARITNGRIEFLGTARGNAQGFPDRDDFAAGDPAPGVPRIAVFGDSFTEAQYLDRNWPDCAEDLAREQGRPVELWNCAISGGGLANWWSVLTRLVGPDHYQLEGIVFAIYPGDLRRTFSMWDHRGGVHPLFGRTAAWDPATYPPTLEQAMHVLRPHPGLILPPAGFGRVLAGHWPPGAPRTLRPFLLATAWRVLRGQTQAAEGSVADQPANVPADVARDGLVGEIRSFLMTRRLRALVVHLPDRGSLLEPDKAPAWPRAEARAFAVAIGAEFVDATELYHGLGRAQIRAQFLPHDGHWSQAGSDRFAAYVLPYLQKFPAHATPAHSRPAGVDSQAPARFEAPSPERSP